MYNVRQVEVVSGGCGTLLADWTVGIASPPFSETFTII
jgi:hypothetical protein